MGEPTSRQTRRPQRLGRSPAVRRGCNRRCRARARGSSSSPGLMAVSTISRCQTGREARMVLYSAGVRVRALRLTTTVQQAHRPPTRRGRCPDRSLGDLVRKTCRPNGACDGPDPAGTYQSVMVASGKVINVSLMLLVGLGDPSGQLPGGRASTGV